LTENKNQKQLQEKELSGLRKLARRRWFYPALYLCVASLILTGMLLFQVNGSSQTDSKKAQDQVVFNQDKPTNPLNAGEEVFQWPSEQASTQVVQPFYDTAGTQQEQQAALVNYNNTFVQNTGINIGAKNDQSFTVTAALSGKVVTVKKDSLLGNIVTLQHSNGVTTLYQSLATTDVKLGQEVKQGDVIGTSGTEALNKAMGVHAHFEIRKNGIPVDPVTNMNKATADIKAVTVGSQATMGVPTTSDTTSGSSTASGHGPVNGATSTGLGR
jgi:Membrane proteins related to metalloendopeptidases